MLSGLRRNSESTRELIIISIVIAFGVNVVTNGLTSLLGIQNDAFIQLLVGAVFSLGTILLLFISKVKRLNRKQIIKGCMIFDTKNRDILQIENYKISEDMHSYLRAAFVENEAMKTIWINHPIYDETTHKTDASSKGSQLLRELIEYSILEYLSTFLCDYFNRSDNRNVKFKEYDRKDIPDVLLENRFLKLFSEPMDNRNALSQRWMVIQLRE